MPIVAETYDGLTNDICGHHITADHALAALTAARAGPVAEGNVGGGTGMQTYEFKRGTGTSSRCFEIEGRAHRVGVLVQSNFGVRAELRILGTPVGQHLRSVANPIELPPLGAPQPYGFASVWLNDAHCDAVYAPTVDAVEEAVINALVAAESVPTFKPRGHVLAALDHQQLIDILRRFGPPGVLI